MMGALIAWLRRMQRDHGPAVGIIAALALLLTLTLLLAAVIALLGALMWIAPYFALVTAFLATIYLIVKQY
jgi:hypothetical protein